MNHQHISKNSYTTSTPEAKNHIHSDQEASESMACARRVFAIPGTGHAKVARYSIFGTGHRKTKPRGLDCISVMIRMFPDG